MRQERSQRRLFLMAAALIAAAGILVYSNTFSVPFLFDDEEAIATNESIRHLWPLWQTLSPPKQMTVSGRPVLNLTLAVNYAISGLEVWSYHVFNLAVHILAALVLYGIVRRTLEGEGLRERFVGGSSLVALAVALMWEVHPLQTESVTYVVQRAESLMGLLYLLTVYCAVRGFSSGGRGWFVGAVVFCALGMGTKEVMVTAPVMVLLYDRVFVSSSFGEAIRRRWRLYGGLSLTWVILAALMAPGPRSASAGFGFTHSAPIGYAMTQVRVVVTYYLRLAVWPDRLVFDYGWPRVNSLGEIAFPGVVLAGLLLGTIAALRRRRGLGFLGVWFFLILAPTSSFVPIADTAVEHRMYLPLAAVVVLAVVGCRGAATWVFGRVGMRAGVCAGLAVLVAAGLGWTTHRRNHDYRSAVAIWTDTLRKRPDNSRAHTNLGQRLMTEGKPAEAVRCFERALQIQPADADALVNLGTVLATQGKYPEAIARFEEVLRIDPGKAGAHFNLAGLLEDRGDAAAAIGHYREALRLGLESPHVYNSLAWLLATHPDARYRDGAQALQLAEQACKLTAYGDPAILDTLAAACAEVGEFAKAVRTAQEAARAARERGRTDLARIIEEHIRCYEAGRPWRASRSRP